MSHTGVNKTSAKQNPTQQGQGEAHRKFYELEVRRFIETVQTHRCETLRCGGRNNFVKTKDVGKIIEKVNVAHTLVGKKGAKLYKLT